MNRPTLLLLALVGMATATTDCSTAVWTDGSWISIPLESSSSAMASAASGTSPASLSFEAVLPRFVAATDETNIQTHWMCDDLENDGPCTYTPSTKTLKFKEKGPDGIGDYDVTVDQCIHTNSSTCACSSLRADVQVSKYLVTVNIVTNVLICIRKTEQGGVSFEGKLENCDLKKSGGSGVQDTLLGLATQVLDFKTVCTRHWTQHLRGSMNKIKCGLENDQADAVGSCAADAEDKYAPVLQEVWNKVNLG